METSKFKSETGKYENLTRESNSKEENTAQLDWNKKMGIRLLLLRRKLLRENENMPLTTETTANKAFARNSDCSNYTASKAELLCLARRKLWIKNGTGSSKTITRNSEFHRWSHILPSCLARHPLILFWYLLPSLLYLSLAILITRLRTPSKDGEGQLEHRTLNSKVRMELGNPTLNTEN